MKSTSKKRNLLFLNYLEGIPSPDFGGPNHVIYDYVANYKGDDFNFDFLSYGAYIPNINYLNLSTSNDFMLGTKKVTNGLYYRNNLFRYIVSNDFYKPFHFWKHNRFFKRHVPGKEYDIIHSHDSIGLSFTKKCTNSKRIMTVHHYLPYSLDMTLPIKNSLIKQKTFNHLRKREILSYELSNVITFPSIAVKNFFLDELKPSNKKEIRIIYNGVDIEKIISTAPIDLKSILSGEVDKFDFIILSVASHEKHKNLDIALETVSKIIHFHKKNVLFFNCGIGSQTDELKNLSEKLGIKNNVIFLGPVKNKDVISLMKASDVFLHLSDKVVFDLVVLEAMACGLCVFASDSGGNKEVIRDEYNGYLIDRIDPDNVANIIVSKRKDLIRMNAVSSVRKYSLENYVRAYSELYAELI